jgi:hypothetical protein
MAAPLSRDARVLESQLAVNHVGHFQRFHAPRAGAERANGARVWTECWIQVGLVTAQGRPN